MSESRSARPRPVVFDRRHQELRRHTLQGFFGSLEGFVDMGLLYPAHMADSENLANQRFLTPAQYHVVVLAHVGEERLSVDVFRQPNSGNRVRSELGVGQQFESEGLRTVTGVLRESPP